MKPFNIILAATSKGEIGYKNTIPWKLEGDLKRFKELTMDNICITGRNTYESLPKPLEGRKMIVVSATMTKAAQENQEIEGLPNKDGVYITSSLERALKIAERIYGKEVFVIGGVRLYEEAFERRSVHTTVYLTLVYKEPEFRKEFIAQMDEPNPNFEAESHVTDIVRQAYKENPSILPVYDAVIPNFNLDSFTRTSISSWSQEHPQMYWPSINSNEFPYPSHQYLIYVRQPDNSLTCA